MQGNGRGHFFLKMTTSAAVWRVGCRKWERRQGDQVRRPSQVAKWQIPKVLELD